MFLGYFVVVAIPKIQFQIRKDEYTVKMYEEMRKVSESRIPKPVTFYYCSTVYRGYSELYSLVFLSELKHVAVDNGTKVVLKDSGCELSRS